MRSRRFNKRVEFWQDTKVADGFGGNTITEVYITKSWCKIKTAGATNRNISEGITNTTDSIIIHLRKRLDIDYNSINQFIKYNGDKYTIQNDPVNVNFNNSIIEIVATKIPTKTATEITPIE